MTTREISPEYSDINFPLLKIYFSCRFHLSFTWTSYCPPTVSSENRKEGFMKSYKDNIERDLKAFPRRGQLVEGGGG
ncbi:MAG TPA: hypothetical protein DCZ94_22415 [Lentisphaeria bacterium]|nr:MAG: hypothetical protein A2X48_13655 [Lentisphaerae bacterium GWF2_49_21]HBC89703.1 hypothetical protein [Lentisphaeria bacterium]